MRRLIENGVGLFIEVEPGKVLWGLMRQIDRSKTCLTVGDEASPRENTIAGCGDSSLMPKLPAVASDEDF